MEHYLDIVFDGPPSMPAPRFIEVEDPDGASVKVGEWVDRGDGTWALRIHDGEVADARPGADSVHRYLPIRPVFRVGPPGETVGRTVFGRTVYREGPPDA